MCVTLPTSSPAPRLHRLTFDCPSKIVRLFSEGLYGSPNKALEALVATPSTLVPCKSLCFSRLVSLIKLRPSPFLTTARAETPPA